LELIDIRDGEELDGFGGASAGRFLGLGLRVGCGEDKGAEATAVDIITAVILLEHTLGADQNRRSIGEYHDRKTKRKSRITSEGNGLNPSGEGRSLGPLDITENEKIESKRERERGTGREGIEAPGGENQASIGYVEVVQDNEGRAAQLASTDKYQILRIPSGAS
jgi:hypothetical protein